MHNSHLQRQYTYFSQEYTQWIVCPKTSMYLPWWTVHHLLQYIKLSPNIIVYKYIIILDPLYTCSSVPYKEQFPLFWLIFYAIFWQSWSSVLRMVLVQTIYHFFSLYEEKMSSILSPIYMAMPISPIFESVATSLSDPQPPTSVEEPGTYGFTKVSTTNFTFRLERRY